MTLVKFKKRAPFRNLITSDFFDSDPIFENRLLTTNLFNGDFWNGKSQEPALNIKETDDAFEVELAAPGFSKKDFEVTIEDGCLNVSAEKSDSKEEENDNYTRKEFSYNSFEKRLQLPDSIKDENVKAKYKDGILSFNLVKKEEAKAKKPKVIEIA
jgi:HSP20 family protein